MNDSKKRLVFTLGDATLELNHALTATSVEYELMLHGQHLHQVVRFTEHQDNLSSPSCGVYVVTEDGLPVYVGSYDTSFSKRWIYPRRRMIYHHKRDKIISSLLRASCIEVWSHKTECNCVSSLELALIKALRPSWNS